MNSGKKGGLPVKTRIGYALQDQTTKAKPLLGVLWGDQAALSMAVEVIPHSDHIMSASREGTVTTASQSACQNTQFPLLEGINYVETAMK